MFINSWENGLDGEMKVVSKAGKLTAVLQLELGTGAEAARVPAAGGAAAGPKSVGPGGWTARNEESARKRRSRERMEKHVREEVEKARRRERERREQQHTGGAGGDGGGEAAPAAAGCMAAPGPAGAPARDAGLVQELAGGAGGKGGGEAASTAAGEVRQELPATTGRTRGYRELAVDGSSRLEEETAETDETAEFQSEGTPTRMGEAESADGEDLLALTKDGLKERCRERGLPSSGNKADLQARLRLPQLRGAAPERDGEKIVTPVKGDQRDEDTGKMSDWAAEVEVAGEEEVSETEDANEKGTSEEEDEKQKQCAQCGRSLREGCNWCDWCDWCDCGYCRKCISQSAS